jgi:hypothetical protein
MLRGAKLDLVTAGTPIAKKHAINVPRGHIVGVTLMAVIYGLAVYASIGLFDDPSSSLIGILNIVILPILMIVAVVDAGRLRHVDAPESRLSGLLTAPLWISFVASLLTVPLWIGNANVDPRGAENAAMHFSPTVLLAPWGFMLAYGVSLVIVRVMFDVNPPITPDANSQASSGSTC